MRCRRRESSARRRGSRRPAPAERRSGRPVSAAVTVFAPPAAAGGETSWSAPANWIPLPPRQAAPAVKSGPASARWGSRLYCTAHALHPAPPPRIYRMEAMHYSRVEQIANAKLPTRWGEFRILGFEGHLAADATPGPQGKLVDEAVVLIMGDVHD